MAARWDETMSRAGLYRNVTRGKIAGVCAGISDRMGVKPIWVRLGFGAFAVVTHGIGILAYVVLAVLMPARAAAVYAPMDGAGGMGYAAAMPAAPMQAAPPPPMGGQPGVRVMDVRTRFTALEARLSRIEAVITSNELSLRRKFRDLGSD